jgi:hypothetical protein
MKEMREFSYEVIPDPAASAETFSDWAQDLPRPGET